MECVAAGTHTHIHVCIHTYFLMHRCFGHTLSLAQVPVAGGSSEVLPSASTTQGHKAESAAPNAPAPADAPTTLGTPLEAVKVPGEGGGGGGAASSTQLAAEGLNGMGGGESETGELIVDKMKFNVEQHGYQCLVYRHRARKVSPLEKGDVTWVTQLTTDRYLQPCIFFSDCKISIEVLALRIPL